MVANEPHAEMIERQACMRFWSAMQSNSVWNEGKILPASPRPIYPKNALKMLKYWYHCRNKKIDSSVRIEDMNKLLSALRGFWVFFSFAIAAIAGPVINLTFTGSPCSPNLGGPTRIEGIGTNSVVATAAADYFTGASLPSSTCTVVLSDELIVSGSGAGFLTFTVVGGAAVFGVNGISESSCQTLGCSPQNGTIPITLGVPFEISVGTGAAYFLTGCCSYGGGIQATVQVYDVVDDPCSGTRFPACPIKEYQVISEYVAPEPGTSWLVVFGVAAFAAVSGPGRRTIATPYRA